jgi:hypothetical protein
MRASSNSRGREKKGAGTRPLFAKRAKYEGRDINPGLFSSGGDMLSRRELIAGGAGMHMARGDAAAAQRDREPDLGPVLDEIRGIRRMLNADPVSSATVATLRDRQRQFYRINQRFPECIDIGIRIFEEMQNWHIRNLRPLNINRTGDGRWQMDFILTVLVLKHELLENEIGQAYDR